jgi:hypothetical protein
MRQRNACRHFDAKSRILNRGSTPERRPAKRKGCRRSAAPLKTVAVQSNLTIKGFAVPPVNKPLHAEWPIALELDTYHNRHLLRSGGKFTRIINISALEVKAKDKRTSSTLPPAVLPRPSCCPTGGQGQPRRQPKPAARAGAHSHASIALCLLVIWVGARGRPDAGGPGHEPASSSGAPSDNYTYNAGGRRDPFLSLRDWGRASPGVEQAG